MRLHGDNDEEIEQPQPPDREKKPEKARQKLMEHSTAF